jgi:hypothetical protein
MANGMQVTIREDATGPNVSLLDIRRRRRRFRWAKAVGQGTGWGRGPEAPLPPSRERGRARGRRAWVRVDGSGPAARHALRNAGTGGAGKRRHSFAGGLAAGADFFSEEAARRSTARRSGMKFCMATIPKTTPKYQIL